MNKTLIGFSGSFFIFIVMHSHFDLSLQSTSFLQIKDESILNFIATIDSTLSKKDKAIQLFYKVRDEFIYDPYRLDLRPERLSSKYILSKKRAWCVEKAIVLAAALRSLAIPARLGYGIVVNHIGVEKLAHYLKRKEIVFHGYVSVFLNEKWIKITPAFDKRICKLVGVSPLEWDGESDVLFQPYEKGKKFMEYIHFYGEFDDVPLNLMKSEMKKYYPHLFEESHHSREFSFIY